MLPEPAQAAKEAKSALKSLRPIRCSLPRIQGPPRRDSIEQAPDRRKNHPFRSRNPGTQATEPRWTTNRDRESAAPKDTKTGHDAQHLQMKKGRQGPAAAGFACGVVIIKGSGSI